MEFLFLPPQPSNEEAHAQAQQKICQDRAKDGGFDDGHRRLTFRDQCDEQDDLNNRPERRLQQDAKHPRNLPPKLLARKTEEVGRRYDRNVVQDENPHVCIGPYEVQRDGGRHERPQEIDDLGHAARTMVAYIEELERVHALPEALTLWLDAGRMLALFAMEGEVVPADGAV